MKVLIITRALSYGGAEKTAVNLANQLAATDEVTLCVLASGSGTYGVSPKVQVVSLDLDIFNKGRFGYF